MCSSNELAVIDAKFLASDQHGERMSATRTERVAAVSVLADLSSRAGGGVRSLCISLAQCGGSLAGLAEASSWCQCGPAELCPGLLQHCLEHQQSVGFKCMSAPACTSRLDWRQAGRNRAGHAAKLPGYAVQRYGSFASLLAIHRWLAIQRRYTDAIGALARISSVPSINRLLEG